MKKLALSTLSLALLGAAGAAQAQSSVTLYGVIDTSITYVHAMFTVTQVKATIRGRWVAATCKAAVSA